MENDLRMLLPFFLQAFFGSALVVIANGPVHSRPRPLFFLVFPERRKVLTEACHAASLRVVHLVTTRRADSDWRMRLMMKAQRMEAVVVNQS